MNATCTVKGRIFIQTMCPSRDIFYRWMNLFDCPIHPRTTVMLKPANKPALGYNSYRHFVSSGAFDVPLQCLSSSKPWKILRKDSKGNVFERWPIFSGTTLLFPTACFLVDPFSEWVSGFTTANMIKTGTLCNENNYGKEKNNENKKKYNTRTRKPKNVTFTRKPKT